MERKLVVASSTKGQELLGSLLESENLYALSIVTNANEARKIITEENFDTIVILTPLIDEFGNELAMYASEHSMAGVILIVKQEISERVRNRVEDFGVFVIETPISRTLFCQALKLVNAARKRFSKLKTENIKLQNKIMHIKTIDRAKCVLIQYLNMSEQQAHKYIEKQAMDRQWTRKEVAENILKTYEN